MFWKQKMKTTLLLLSLKEHTKNLMEHLLMKEQEKLRKDTMSVFNSVCHRWMDGEGLTVDSLTLEKKNEIYSKVVETSKQGWFFGLGSLQSGILMSLEASSVLLQTDEVGTLTTQVKELEAELQKSRDDNTLFKDRLEALEDFCYRG